MARIIGLDAFLETLAPPPEDIETAALLLVWRSLSIENRVIAIRIIQALPVPVTIQ